MCSNIRMCLAYPIFPGFQYAWHILTIPVSNIGILLGLFRLFRCLILGCAQPMWTIHISNIKMCSAYPDLPGFQYWGVLGLSELFRFLILGCARPIQTIHVSNIEILLGLSAIFRFLILGCLTYSDYSCF